MGNPNEVNDPSSTNPPSSPMLDRSTTYSFNEGEYLIFYHLTNDGASHAMVSLRTEHVVDVLITPVSPCRWKSSSSP